MSSNPFDRDEEPEAWEEYQNNIEAEYNDKEEYPPENEPDGDD